VEKGGNKRDNLTGNQTAEFQLQVLLVKADGKTLEESIEWLRQIEKRLGVTVQKVAAEGHSAELWQLQRDHITAAKALSDSEIRVMRLQQKRGQLITIDEAKAMITKTLTLVLVELQKLVDQARDDAFKSLLRAAGNDPVMQKARDFIFVSET